MKELPKNVIIKRIANVRWGCLELPKLIAVFNILFDTDVKIQNEKH